MVRRRHGKAGRSPLRSGARRTSGLLLALLATLTVAAPARSDLFRELDRERVQMELERTDQVIARAKESLHDCASVKGGALLNDAVHLQDQAWDRFRSVRPNDDPRAEQIALKLTLEARDRAVNAIETCQVEFRALESLREMLDSTQKLIAEARSRLAVSNDVGARRLIDAGAWQLDKAREAYRAGEPRKALTLAGAARTLVQRAMQQAEGDASAGGRIEEILERTDQLLSEIRESVGDRDPKAVALLDRAFEDQARAKGLFHDGRSELALRRTRVARSRALDALWLVESSPEAAQVRRAVEMVDRMLQEAAPAVRASQDSQAVQLLDAAVEQLQVAKRNLKDGQEKAAAEAARTADTLLRRALERIEGS